MQEKIKELIDTVNDSKDCKQCFLEIVKYAEEHPKVIYHIFNSAHAYEFEAYFNKAFDTVFDSYINEVSKDGFTIKSDKRLITKFYQKAFMGIMFDWIKCGMKFPLTEEIERLIYLFDGNVLRAIERSTKKSE